MADKMMLPDDLLDEITGGLTDDTWQSNLADKLALADKLGIAKENLAEMILVQLDKLPVKLGQKEEILAYLAKLAGKKIL